jgi:hypothetical protein
MQVITCTAAAAGLLFACMSVLADVQYEQGQASLTYSGKSVPPAVRAQAIQTAELKAIETYYAKAGGSESANFDSIKDKVTSRLDQYVLAVSIIEEQDHKDVHEYTVSLRAKLNVSELDNAIKATFRTAIVPLSAKSRMTFLVVARQASTQTDFGPLTFEQVDKSKTSGSRSSAGATRADTSVSRKSGGGSTRQAPVTSWRIYPSSNMDQALTEVFHEGGFRVTEAGDVEQYSGGKLHVAAVQDDYKSGMDLQAQTLRDVEAGLRNAKIPYLTLGTLDIGFADPDLATGLLRVSVTVNAKVLDLRDAIPDIVATVGPVQYAGLGTTESEAQTNALKLAAQNAAKKLVSQLNNAGVH